SEQTKGITRRGQFGQTLSLSHSLGRLTVAGELWHFTQPLTATKCRREFVGRLVSGQEKSCTGYRIRPWPYFFLDAVGRVCGLHVSFASPTVGIPRSKIKMTRDQLSLSHLQWFTRHLGNKTARAPLSIVTFRNF